jgi:two-component system, cell cycle response regulator DivK
MAAPKLILLVEDNEDNRIVFRAVLEHHGNAILCAFDGEMGVALAVRHRPDLILMDIMMPKLDGIEATRRIRADELLARTPIIGVTGSDTPTAELLESGFDLVLRKPIAPSELVRAVESVT